MTVLVAVVRLVLAGVFVFSAVAKLRDRSGTRRGVADFGVPTVLVGFVAGALPVVEIACAVLLVLPDPFATVGAAGSLTLLLVFTAAIVANLVQGRHPECHCFGDVGGSGGIDGATVARNAALMVLAAVSLIGAGSLSSVPSALGELSAGEAAVLSGVGLLTAALVVMGLALRTLLQRYGSVLLRLEALEEATGIAAPNPAPHFILADLEGVELSLDQALGEGRPVLVAFISPTCHHCSDLLPDLSAWQTDPQHPLSVVVISDGSAEDNRAKTSDVGPLRVLLQPDQSVSNAYGVQGTPAAALIGADGLLVDSIAHSVEGVRSLHEGVMHRMAHHHAAPAAGAEPVHTIGPRPVSEGDQAPPEVLLVTESGDEVTATEAFGPDAVALFWRTDCGFCAQIAEAIRDLEESVPLRLITGSDVAAVRASGLRSPILRQDDAALERWLGVPGTPSAARFRGNSLDSVVAIGGPDVLALVRETARLARTVD